MLPSAETADRRRHLPHWLVALVILLTGGFTVWAMSMTNLRGPALAWDQAHDMVDGVWGERKAAPLPPSWTASPQWSSTSGAQQVAGFPRVPCITAGATPVHADRGVCTNCHTVRTTRGTIVPSISSLSVMPHVYRGVCSNCHEFTFATTSASRLVARTAVGGVGVAPRNAAKQPTEGEWQGLEVAPSARGVVVAGVEGAAARRGVLVDDVVTSINGVATPTMADFVAVTRNGALQQGTMIVERAGQRLAFDFGTSRPARPLTPAATNNFPPAPGQVGRQQVQF